MDDEIDESRQQQHEYDEVVLQRENDDLRTATSQAENIVMELSLNGKIRFLSNSWEDIVGTKIKKLHRKSIARIIVGDMDDRQMFEKATQVMEKEDMSYRVRFSVRVGKLQEYSDHTPLLEGKHEFRRNLSENALSSSLPTDSKIKRHAEGDTDDDQALDHGGDYGDSSDKDSVESSLSLSGDEFRTIELEGQGLLIRDRYGKPTHTMWILKPFVAPDIVQVDLPQDLVHSLGFGADVLVTYLETLSNLMVTDMDSVPSPPTELCRICERHVPTWWFERHSNICALEHKCESEVQISHESLMEQRSTIASLLAAMDNRTHTSAVDPPASPPPSFLSDGSSSNTNTSLSSSPQTPTVEYRGFSLPLPSLAPDSVGSPPRSPVRQPTSPLATSVAKRALNHKTTGSKKSPIRLLELLLELCDMALQIKVPEMRHDQDGTQIHSPQSETRIHQVQGWAPSQVDDPGLAALCNDTETYAKRKVDAAIRLGNTIVYSEKIRKEIEASVQQVVEETVEGIIQKQQEYFDGAVGDEEDMADDEMEDEEARVKEPQPLCPPGGTSNHKRDTSMFSDSYLHGDELPEAAATDAELSGPAMLSTSPSTVALPKRVVTDESNDMRQKSVTPKSILTGMARFRHNMSGGVLDSDSGGNEEAPPEFNLNNNNNNNAVSPRIRQRRSTMGLNTNLPNSPRAMGSPLNVSRNSNNSSNAPYSPSSPFSSPQLMPNDHERHHRRHSSAASDFSRAPVSPLLSSTVPSTKPPQPSIRDYEIISPISKGAFGSVYLSRKKLTGEYFAIKVLKKSDMVVKNQVTNVKAERAILMAQADSPFVAKLFYTFQSKEYLFLVMEYLNGGDCAALIKALGGLSEAWTQKYVAEVVVGVEDLHKKGIVHRDLKPDNLLINQEGHLKLTDFGLSRMGLIGRHTKIRGVSASGTHNSSAADTPVETPTAVRTPSEMLVRSSGSMLHDPSISLVPGYFNLNRTSSSGPSVSTTSNTSGSTEADSPSSSANTPVPTPPMVLFDPENNTRKFVGTPDYLAPETIYGVGQDERSDWWSLGCILFEFLFGYPPFHDETPEKVFNNILARNIQWPSELDVSKEALDLIEKLLCTNADERLGANGADEIKTHAFFADISNWNSLWSEKASFVPDIDNPECTDYFDSRGAVMQEFPEEMAAEDNDDDKRGSESQSDSSEQTTAGSPGWKKSGSNKAKYMPLHIPPHVRDSNRSRRLSEPNQQDDFGSFSFKNLPVLEKANKDLIHKLRNENMEHRNSVSEESRARGLSISTSNLKRGASPNSVNSNNSGQSSPRHHSASGMSPVFNYSSSTPPPQIRARMASTASSATGSEDDHMPQNMPARSIPQSSRKLSSGLLFGSPEGMNTQLQPPRRRRRSSALKALASKNSSPELYEEFLLNRKPHAASSSSTSVQVFDMSPCNSDDEDVKSSALQRVQKRRQASQQQTDTTTEPYHRTLDVMVCDMNPVWRYSTEKMLVRMGNRVVSVSNGPEAIRRATGDIKFDMIFIEYKLPKTSGADVARLIHNTINPNTATPIVAMTNFVNEANAEGGKDKKVFEGVLAKPTSPAKLRAQLETLCNWREADYETDTQAAATPNPHKNDDAGSGAMDIA